MLREKLERHQAVQLGVLGFVDDAHAALVKFLNDFIARYSLTNHMLRVPMEKVGILEGAGPRARTELSYCDTTGASFLFNSSAQFRTTMICVDAASWSGSLIMKNRWPSVVTS